MQPWLKTMLIAQGHMTETGLTRNAKIRICKRCSIPTLAGLDADIMALEARCDLADLNRLGEVMILAQGRDTYTLVGKRLNRRDQYTIVGRPAGNPDRPVLAAHQCGQRIPTEWTTPYAPPTPSTGPNAGSEPPF